MYINKFFGLLTELKIKKVLICVPKNIFFLVFLVKQLPTPSSSPEVKRIWVKYIFFFKKRWNVSFLKNKTKQPC